MNIMLFNDGRLLITPEGQPINGGDLVGVLVCITNPQEGDVLTYNGTMWVNAQPTTPETPEETEPAGTEG